MAHDEGQFRGEGGLELYWQRWRPEAQPTRGIIVMLHGDFAHSGWYVNLPNHIVTRGYAVYAFDRRGWGRSPGQRGYINTWREYLDDLDAYLQFVRLREPGCPIFLMGHTGSASIVLEYAAYHPGDIQGVFCVSPVLSASAFPAPLLALAKILSAIVPRMTIDVSRRLDSGFSTVSHDAAFVEQIRKDPLRNGKLTPRWVVESTAAIERVNAQAQAVNFPVPLLILLGGADRNSDLGAAKEFFQRVSLKDKEIREYPGAYTNLLPDTPTPQVLDNIDAWLDNHLQTRKT